MGGGMSTVPPRAAQTSDPVCSHALQFAGMSAEFISRLLPYQLQSRSKRLCRGCAGQGGSILQAGGWGSPCQPFGGGSFPSTAPRPPLHGPQGPELLLCPQWCWKGPQQTRNNPPRYIEDSKEVLGSSSLCPIPFLELGPRDPPVSLQRCCEAADPALPDLPVQATALGGGLQRYF